MRLLPIVEGPGDVAAVQVLLRRLLHERHQIYDVDVIHPYRYGDFSKVAKNFVRQVLAASKENAPILWTMDCDDGSPGERVRFLEEQLPRDVHVPVKFAFFRREYECMFLAEHQCLVTELRVSPDGRVGEPEAIRGAKACITRMMARGTAYKEMVHQVRLTAKMDLAVALENSASLRHLDTTLLSLIRPA